MHALARRNPAQNPQTATPAFKRWFGQSAVVDAKGQPLVVYHGTATPTFEVFSFHHGISAPVPDAAYFTDTPAVADDAAGYGPGRAVYPVYLRMLRPLVIDAEGAHAIHLTERVVRALSRGRYDGVILKNVREYFSDTPSTTYAVFEPSQVKSATGNAGTFDPADPSILRNPVPRRRNPAPRYVLLGVDDEVQVCDDCGKADLKCTVVLGVLDADGNIDHEVRFGRDCAAKALRKPRTVTAAKMEKLAREAAYNRVRAMTVGAPSRVKVEGGRFPTYYFAYPLTDGRTLIVQESDPSFRPPAGSWTRLREGAWVGHPAKSNPRRRNPAKLSYDVVGIHDTRDYERDATGKWKPVPGSGEHRPCDVCQHDHVVHVVLREMREPTQADLAARTPAEAAFMVRAGVTVPTGNTPVVGRDCAEQMTGRKISKTSWDAATAKAVTASRRSRR